MEHLLGIQTAVPEFFDVLLHFGTLAAVFLVFWKDIAGMAKAIPSLFTNRPSDSKRLIWLLIIGTLPLIAVLPFTCLVESLKDNVYFIGGALILTALLLFLTSKLSKGDKDEGTARFTDALAVGIAQALAVTPGLSRSGATLTVGLMSGFTRNFAIRYAFLLSVPAVLGATAVKFSRALGDFDPALIPACVAGVLASAAVGVLCIGLVRKLAARLHYFAIYCATVGVLAIVIQLTTNH